MALLCCMCCLTGRCWCWFVFPCSTLAAVGWGLRVPRLSRGSSGKRWTEFCISPSGSWHGLMQRHGTSVCLGSFLSSSLWHWGVPMVSGRGNSSYAFTILGILLIMSHLQKSPTHACAVSGFLRAAGSSGTAARCPPSSLLCFSYGCWA